MIGYQICDVLVCVVFFFFKHKTAYDMRISDWSSDVCSSDLRTWSGSYFGFSRKGNPGNYSAAINRSAIACEITLRRSEEHTSELQSLMRISYAVFCLKKKNYKRLTQNYQYNKH